MQYEIIEELPLSVAKVEGDHPDTTDYELGDFLHDDETDTYFRVRRTWSYDRGSYWHTLEEEISSKEYFKRKLTGTLPGPGYPTSG